MTKAIIVGFGSAGQQYFRILKKNKSIEKIYIIDKEISEKFNKYKITTEEIKKNKIFFDFAFIATPSNLHFKYAEFFLKRKSHVLIEKPFVLKISDGKKLIKLSKKVKKKCWTALQNRYNLATKELKNSIKKNELGKIVMVNCSMFWSRDKKYYSNGWRGKYISDGGVLTNQAIHLLDLLIYLIGDIRYFSAIAGFNKKKLEAEDLITINIRHNNDNYSSFSATTRANIDYQSSIDLIGEKGRSRVTGISLNIYQKYIKNRFVKFAKYSENFSKGIGAVRGMGNGHEKILSEFLQKNNKNSSCGLEIEKNIYTIKVIHSIYNYIHSKNFLLKSVTDRQGILGK